MVNKDISLGNGYFLRIIDKESDMSYSTYGKNGFKLELGQGDVYNCFSRNRMSEYYTVDTVEYCREHVVIKGIDNHSGDEAYWILLMKKMRILGPMNAVEFSTACEKFSIQLIVVDYIDKAQLL